MLHRLTLTNFKAFQTAEIHLAPITLVFGQNSSGKSSIIEALKILGHGLKTLSSIEGRDQSVRWLEHYRDVTYENHQHLHEPDRAILFALSSTVHEALWSLPTNELTAPDPTKPSPLGIWSVREILNGDDEDLGTLMGDISFSEDFLRLLVADSEDDVVQAFDEESLDFYIGLFFLGRLSIPPSEKSNSEQPQFIKMLVLEPRSTNEDHLEVADLIRDLAGEAGVPSLSSLGYEVAARETSWDVHAHALVSWFSVRRLAQFLLYREAFDGALRSVYEDVVDQAIRSYSDFPDKEVLDTMIGWLDDLSVTHQLVNRCAEVIERHYTLPSLYLTTPTRAEDPEEDALARVLGSALCKLIDQEILCPRQDWLDRAASARWAHVGPTRALVRDGSELRDIEGRDSTVVGVDGSMFPLVLAEHPELVGSLNEWLERFNTGYSYAQNNEIMRPIEPDRHGQRDLRAGIQLTDLRRLDEDGEPIAVGFEDVGYGISQISPIIVQLEAPMGPDALVTIEQPELHIHPRLQTELAELFIHSASADRGVERKQIVIETHSEHILLRIQRRIREQTLSPHDVSVLYVDIDEAGASCVLKLRMNDQGSFVDEWPDGFFGERLMELLSM